MYRLFLLLGAPVPSPQPHSPSPAGDPPSSWADQMDAVSTLVAAPVAAATAVATIWLLVHRIGETLRARREAQRERADAATDRAFAAAERREAERVQARRVVVPG